MTNIFKPEPMPPEIFDNPEAILRAGVDIDVFDSMRALLHEGVDLDDRAAIEHVIIAPDCYRGDPATFSRFVDACIWSAKANRAAGGMRRFAYGESGFVSFTENDQKTLSVSRVLKPET